MDLGRIDQMTEFAVEVLADGDARRVGALVRDMAHAFGQDPALAIAFALTSAAASIEDVVSDEDGSAPRAYKLAALVAADVLAVQAMGRTIVNGKDLLHFWRRADPYFLNL